MEISVSWHRARFSPKRVAEGAREKAVAEPLLCTEGERQRGKEGGDCKAKERTKRTKPGGGGGG